MAAHVAKFVTRFGKLCNFSQIRQFSTVKSTRLKPASFQRHYAQFCILVKDNSLQSVKKYGPIFTFGLCGSAVLTLVECAVLSDDHRTSKYNCVLVCDFLIIRSSEGH